MAKTLVIDVTFDGKGNPICVPGLTEGEEGDTFVWQSSDGDFEVEFPANSAENPFTNVNQKFTAKKGFNAKGTVRGGAIHKKYTPTAVRLNGKTSQNGQVKIVPDQP
jgi:hypothetical protein